MNSKKEVLETWFRKVWTEESAATINEMFVPEKDNLKTASGLKKEEALGPKEFEVFHSLLLALVKDIRVSIDFCLEQGDWITAACTLTAKNRKSKPSETVTMEGCVIGKIVDGKILSARNYFDFLNLFERLGLLPDDTFQKCLTGNHACD